MFSFDGRLTVLCVAALLTLGASAGSAAQEVRVGSVKGTVTDTSPGVLPGVVVSAVAADGRTLSTMVTGGTGEFSFDRLPIGPIDLLFHLDGFDDARVSVTVQPAGLDGVDGTAKVAQQLQLKAFAESVVVRGDPPPPPPVPRPVLRQVPEHDPASVCGPAKAEGVVQSAGTVLSGPTVAGRGLFGARDQVLIDGGSNARIGVGDNFIVRRRYPTPLTRVIDRKRVTVMGEHSAGLVQIVSVDEDVSTAVVVYACDAMISGDYLVRFDPEPANVPEPTGVPLFDKAARILFADTGQGVGIANRMLVIDRGVLDGVQAGQRFTLFRRTLGHSRPVIVGEAVVVAARRDSATILVQHVTDVVFPGVDGDWAAPQQPRRRANQ